MTDQELIAAFIAIPDTTGHEIRVLNGRRNLCMGFMDGPSECSINFAVDHLTAADLPEAVEETIATIRIVKRHKDAASA